MFFESKLHMEMAKTIVQSIRPNVGRFLQFLGVLLPALRGEHVFENRAQNEHLTIVLLNLVHQLYVCCIAGL